ncbi:putative efflux transporter protein [Pseudonocardia sp. Ae168_Ps1]|uniref:MFS transporter n=1 Tax=unclassified Pseudonocardia TaxID=2619320 RepID=UPI00094B1A69|nr:MULTISPECIES: MFS transporter [unclassified Pseudonocardia]OLL74522.1 putative efflux transporter protein [Pseudonocardia sp. Ae150A_Ps1]OLL80501.1 putative efflux transporter protein [Pseudonocardia sp. Ae168_Ps1]OLL85371.1 putative efflux transporter protein [Pseudonocardia sp. Ae263_Ps1]OLL94602.1 putative efflux transporter protein [Pseudonocardia sp. Ae356_Ps1]
MTPGGPAGGRGATRSLRRVQTAFAANTLGDAAGTIALPLFVLQTTGSLTLTGVLVAVATAGSLVSAFVVGPWVDRLGLRRSAQLALLAGSLLTGAIVVLDAAGALSITALLVISLLRATADPPGEAALTGLLPPLAREAGVPLERANGTVRLVRALCDLVGPLVAGGVIVLLGAEVVLAIDALSGLVALVILRLSGGTAGEPVTPDGPAPPSSWAARAREGARLLAADATLRVLVLGSAAFAALDIGFVTIVLTDYATSVLDDPALFGVLISGFGCGSLAGTVAYALRGHRLPRRATFLGAYLVLAGTVLALAAGPGLLVAFGLLVVCGLVVAPLDNMYVSVLQERVPAQAFGRVSTLVTATVTAPAPLAVPLIAAAVTGFGLSTTLVALGAVYLALVAGMALARPLRGLDASREAVTPRGAPPAPPSA